MSRCKQTESHEYRQLMARSFSKSIAWTFAFNAFINPLVTDLLYLVCKTKISIVKKRIIEKISYERRGYESVDDRNHS